MRMRKKPNLIPRLEACREWILSDPAGQRGRWREIDPEAEQIWLELGCGKGRFTVGTAQAHPEVLLLALERVPEAMVMAVERAKENQVKNVRFWDADAAQVETFFQPGEVDRIFINFCDPWPGARAAKRRLTHPAFLLRDWKVLAPGGEIHFKTDNAVLFKWSLAQFPKAGFAVSEVTHDLHQDGPCGIMTDYEEKFYRQGQPIFRCVGTRIEKTGPFSGE